MPAGSVSRTDAGVQFAATDGRRSSQAAGMTTLADAVRAVDADLAHDIEHAGDWRRDYVAHLARLEAVSARSAKAAQLVAADGMEALYRQMVFGRDGTELPVRQALATYREPRFDTVVVAGEGRRADRLELPYRGQLLAGDTLRRTVDRWVAAGVVEPSSAEAICRVATEPDWLDASDLQVALIGAGAEMGPLAALCRWGATVLAVDVPNADLWSRIIATARRGSGRLHVPTRRPVTADDDEDLAWAAGADLLAETPEVRTWLASVDGPLVIGSYAYADGGAFVRVAVAADAVIADLLDHRPDCAVAYLASPTDAFAVPSDVVDHARARAGGRWPGRLAHAPLRALSGGRLFVPHYATLVPTDDGTEVGIADSIVPQQGPNYALAKRLQRWRAFLARERGVVSSANVAPATRTRSVLHSRALAAAYAGASHFGVEIFEPATSSMLMAALLLHDLRNPSAPAQPTVQLRHPADLLTHAAAHGGLWRIPYEPRSVLPLAALLGLPQVAGTRTRPTAGSVQ